MHACNTIVIKWHLNVDVCVCVWWKTGCNSYSHSIQPGCSGKPSRDKRVYSSAYRREIMGVVIKPFQLDVEEKSGRRLSRTEGRTRLVYQHDSITTVSEGSSARSCKHAAAGYRSVFASSPKPGSDSLFVFSLIFIHPSSHSSCLSLRVYSLLFILHLHSV